MSEASLELKKSVRAALTADSSLNVLISGMFDAVPDKTNYPFIAMTDAASEDWSTVSRKGLRITLTLDVYARDGGTKPCLDIAEKIYAALHQKSLVLDTHSLVSIQYQNARAFQLPDARTYQVQANYEALIQLAEV